MGTIDEDPEEAMARTADRKLSIACSGCSSLRPRSTLSASDIMFDLLVLLISTGMEKDRRRFWKQSRARAGSPRRSPSVRSPGWA
ncbi:MAG: hypothetical protein R3C45_11205 [Phycisphaerales bacterium]